MQNIIIYGAGGTGDRLYRRFTENKQYNVLCFADSSPQLQGKKKFDLPIIAPEELDNQPYDYIIIATLPGYESVFAELTENRNIPEEKIIGKYVEFSFRARIAFLKCQSELIREHHLPGNIAEGGVFEGEFAKCMNEYFPDRKLYLFDTFEGFDRRDVHAETVNNFSHADEGYFCTDILSVKKKMPFPDQCIFFPGYFPESAGGVDDTFIFVSLDFDLYNPTRAGLDFFYPKLAEGGMILVHDYFPDVYKGVRQAVADFRKDKNIRICPVGDEISIAILK